MSSAPNPTDDVAADADRLLMGRIGSGDMDAFGELYDRYGVRAYRVARSVCRDDGRAEDAVQDAFMSIWRSRTTFEQHRGSVSAWVLSVVRNRAIDLTRRNKNHDGLRASEDTLKRRAAPGDVADQVEARGVTDKLHELLELLPETQREVIVLAYYGQLTHEEIAVHLHLPPGTVKGRMRLGLQKLRADTRPFVA